MLTLLGAVRPDGELAVSSLSCCAALSCNSSRELFTKKRVEKSFVASHYSIRRIWPHWRMR